MVLILYGNSEQVEHAYRKKYFRIKKMRFVTDLDLIILSPITRTDGAT